MKTTFALFGILAATVAFCEPTERPFYVFENGARFASHEKKAEALKDLGFDGIGSAALPTNGDIESMLKAYRNNDLRVFSFYVGINLGEAGKTRPETLAETIPKLKGSGATLELYVRGKKSANSDEQAVAFVQKIASLAKAAEINIALYPHTGFYIETIGDAVRIAKKCDRSNVGVMFNLCHFLKVEPDSDLNATLKFAKPYLRQVSISGATIGGNSWPELIQPLGLGDYEIASFLELLDEIRFTGPVGLQCYNIKGDPMDYLKKSATTWKSLSISKKQ